ncbi:MAG TPA: hypothetical protein VKV26_24535 [Dehalococcoidia bacterium]|nr:hypothetical protein [Dehalococcoidia bacterium]
MSARTAAATRLIGRWLEPNPHKPGAAEWRIRFTGLPVWRIVGQLAVEACGDDPAAYRAIIDGDVSRELIERVATYYDVAAEAIEAALAYAGRHPDAVISRLVLDRAALPG